MIHETSYLIRIRTPEGKSWFAHTASGRLCEYNDKRSDQAQLTRLIRKANAGRVATETFELYPIYY